MEHTLTIVGYTDEFGLNLVRLRCSCGWASDEFDSEFHTLEEINERAATLRFETASWPD